MGTKKHNEWSRSRGGWLGGMLAGLSLTGLGFGASFEFTHYRFVPVANRDRVVYPTTGTQLIQLSELQFFHEGAPVSVAGVTVTSESTNHPGGEDPPKVVDGDLGSKWLNFNYTSNATLIVAFPEATAIDSYNLVTGNDAPERDPVSWRLEGGSSASGPWQVLDVVTMFGGTAARSVPMKPTPFELPEGMLPVIEDFRFDVAGQSPVVADGTTIDFYVNTQLATSVTLSAEGMVPMDLTAAAEEGTVVSLIPPVGVDSMITLTATSPGGEVTRQIPVRSVTAGDVVYQYVRYTPVKTKGNGDVIQITDFRFLDDGVEVVPVGVTNPGGVNAPDADEGVEKLIDEHDYTNQPPSTPEPTKWLDVGFNPVVFDFGEAVSIDSYSFVTGNDAEDRDPVRWIMEGSLDGENWTLIEEMTKFDFPVSDARLVVTPTLPMPAGSLRPAVIDFRRDLPIVLPGETVTLNWNVLGAVQVGISPSVGEVSTSGEIEVNPTEDTTYTLTAVGMTGITTSEISVRVLDNASGVIDYPNFDDAEDISLVGSATILNDGVRFPSGGDSNRLRLTNLSGGQNGAAWYFSPVPVANGFVTEFAFEPANPNYINGADGISFMVQNTAERNGALATAQLYIPQNTLAVTLDAYQNEGNLSNASVEVYVNGEVRTRVDLVALGLAKGYNGAYQTIVGTYGQPYQVKISYVPGDLDVWVDGVQVITNLVVDLGGTGVYDEDGRAYVGFAGRTGGLAQYQDILNWSLEPVAPAVADLKLLDYSFQPSLGQASLTWQSEAGVSYQVTTSTTLEGPWTSLTPVPVVGEAGQTSTSVSFTPVGRAFFRVETVNP